MEKTRKLEMYNTRLGMMNSIFALNHGSIAEKVLTLILCQSDYLETGYDADLFSFQDAAKDLEETIINTVIDRIREGK